MDIERKGHEVKMCASSLVPENPWEVVVACPLDFKPASATIALSATKTATTTQVQCDDNANKNFRITV